jgi:hypothetical protein
MTTKSSGAPGGGPALPTAQTCAKCGAQFRWEPSDPTVKNSPLAAHLVKPSDTCDCGYGALAPVLGT